MPGNLGIYISNIFPVCTDMSGSKLADPGCAVQTAPCCPFHPYTARALVRVWLQEKTDGVTPWSLLLGTPSLLLLKANGEWRTRRPPSPGSQPTLSRGDSRCQSTSAQKACERMQTPLELTLLIP